jgi:hypothetical protein
MTALTVALVATALPSVPAHAGELFSVVNHRLELKQEPVKRWSYDAFGNSVLMPGCATYPGVTQDADIWARTYIDGSTTVKLNFKMTTRYSEPVAVAKLARPDFTCGQLKQFDYYASKYGDEVGVVRALNESACRVAANASTLWCRLAAQRISLPTLNLDLNERCRQPRFTNGGLTANLRLPSFRGPAVYQGWHNAHVVLSAKDDLIKQGAKSGDLPDWARGLQQAGLVINAPTIVDDFEMIGGMASIDPKDKRPAGVPGAGKAYDQYVGMGKVQSFTAANLYVNWVQNWAQSDYERNPRKFPNPATNPVTAQVKIWDRIKQYPNGDLAKASNALLDQFCTNSQVPWMSDVMEKWANEQAPANAPGPKECFKAPAGTPWVCESHKVSLVAEDYVIRTFFDKEIAARTNSAERRNAVCVAIQNGAVESGDASLWGQAAVFCRYGLISTILDSLYVTNPAETDPLSPYCNNRFSSIKQFGGKWYSYPPGFWSTAFGMNLGCGPNEHLRHFFGVFKDLL